MKSILSLSITLLILIVLAYSSKQDAYAICNQYRETVRFENKESSGNDCNAPPNGVCYSEGKRAFIPKCESAKDFEHHRFIIHIGEMEYSIWKKDSDGIIYGGNNPDYNCRGNLLAHYDEGDSWNIVIHPDASVSLVSFSQSCPQAPTPSNHWDPPKGYWKPVQTITGGQELSLSLSIGTSSTDSESHSSTWATSLSTSISTKLLFASISVSASISHTVATQSESSFTKSEQVTRSFKCTTNDKTEITMYQWIIMAGHNGKQTTIANTPNVICVYGMNGPAPKCPLGACANSACSFCKPWKRQKDLNEIIEDVITDNI